MHDTLIQGCVGVSTLLEAASLAEAVSPKLNAELVDRARREVRSTIDEARLAIWNLRHAPEQDQTLTQSLCRLTERAAAESGASVHFAVSGTPLPLSADVQRSLTLVLREAIQNAIRHSGASRIKAQLAFGANKVDLLVEDDGRGFDAEGSLTDDTHHYGLIGMRERIERHGGEFELSSGPGRGTRVLASLPFRQAAKAVPEC